MIPMRTVKFSTSEIQKAERLAPEIEEGNREYKFKLTDLSDDQLTHRITQLNWRLNEGNDEAFYLIGVEDNGNQLGLNDADLQESLRNLQFIADQVGCEMTVRQLYAGVQGTTAEVHMRRRQRITVDVVHVNVAVAGDLNSGKSTMIGVLSTGRLDNGKGLARMQVLTHNHEVESGTTSCISHHSLHFGKDGEVLNSDPLPGMGKGNRLRTLSDLELADETSRSVTLIDLAGHSKYLKTTLHGLIGRRPDHCIVCVSATTGLNNITAEHLGVCMYLNVPLVIVITKEDCVGRGTVIKPKAKAKAAAKARNDYATQEEVSEEVPTTAPSTTDAISRLVAGVRDVLTGSQHESTLITTDGELVQHLMREADAARPTVPIFTVSNVTGSGLQLLRSYLFQLPGHAKQRASAAESACVRILGSIGNTDERDEVVFPRDEEQFVLNKKPVRERRYVNRDNADLGSGKYNTECNSEVGICLMAPSTSDDNIAARDVKLAPSTPCSNIRKSYSSPDLPATTASAAGQSGGKNIKISGTPDEKSTTREFSEYVEAGASPGPESTSCRDSPSSQVSSGTGAGSRTKVLIGSIEAGKISVGQGLLLGPTCRGEFLSVTVSSLRLNNVPVCTASAGQTVTFKLSEGPGSTTITSDSAFAEHASGIAALGTSGRWQPAGRKRSSAAGLVLLGTNASSTNSTATVPQAHWEFEAELLVLNHPSKIRANYEPVVHVGCVKQAAKMVSVRKISAQTGKGGAESGLEMQDELGNGEKGLCRFRFLYYPEYIIPGEAMIIREQRTRGVGTITTLLS